MTTDSNSTPIPESAPFDRFANHHYRSPSPGRLALVACHPNNGDLPLDSVMSGHVKECGLNTVITRVNLSGLKTSMTTAKNDGINTIVQHPYLGPHHDHMDCQCDLSTSLPEEGTTNPGDGSGNTGDWTTNPGDGIIDPGGKPVEPTEPVSEEEQHVLCRSLVESLASEPGLAGYMPCVKPSLDSLPKLNPYIREIDGTLYSSPERSTKPPFGQPLIFLMLPEQATPPDLYNVLAESNAPYLPQVQISTGPSVWVSDSAAWSGNSISSITPRYKEFYNNMKIMELMSVYTNRPFWGTVKCLPLRSTSPAASEEPDGAMLFPAMSALAHGAQGLVFTDFRQSLSVGGTTHNPFPVQKLFPTWTYVKPVVDYIRNLEGVFLGALPIQTVHTGSIPFSGPLGSTLEKANVVEDDKITDFLYGRMHVPVGPLLKVERNAASVQDPEATDYGVSVSHLSLLPTRSMLDPEDFGDEALDFLVLVNQDMRGSQTVDLTLSPYYALTEVHSAVINDTGDCSANHLSETPVTPGTANVITRTLPPGGALVLRWHFDVV